MQLCSPRFGKGIICCIPDQEMPEAIRLVIAKQSRRRPHQLLSHEPNELFLKGGGIRHHGLHDTAMKGSSFYCSALKDTSLPRLELIQPGCQERLDRRGNSHLSPARFPD